jgi:pSer/pThr/pTyr-binding forkhead associated (FHA) protein
MAEKVILTLKNEDGVTEEFTFQQPASCLLGRSRDCTWQSHSAFVSRRHCLFRIDPPFVSVRDLGSLNGTYVNGERIDGDYDLVDGDVIQAGTMRCEVGAERKIEFESLAI